MVEMTVPGQRRMALTPTTCPISDQTETKKAASKSASTLSSEENQKESPSLEMKTRNKTYGLLDSRKTWTKSMVEQPIAETNNSSSNCYRLASSPNLSMLEDRRGSDVIRNRLTPLDAMVPIEADGKIDGACLFSNYDRTSHSSDPESNGSDDRALSITSNKAKKKKRDKSNNNLSSSERNIASRVRNGSITSPFFKRLVGLGRSKSNKGLNRADSADSDKLLNMTNVATPHSTQALPRNDSSINILITEVDSDNESSGNQWHHDKQISNGRKTLDGRIKRSISLFQSSSVDGMS